VYEGDLKLLVYERALKRLVYAGCGLLYYTCGFLYYSLKLLVYAGCDLLYYSAAHAVLLRALCGLVYYRLWSSLLQRGSRSFTRSSLQPWVFPSSKYTRGDHR
jgi:hypothetical protein